jgi:hypothetical protein
MIIPMRLSARRGWSLEPFDPGGVSRYSRHSWLQQGDVATPQTRRQGDFWAWDGTLDDVYYRGSPVPFGYAQGLFRPDLDLAHGFHRPPGCGGGKRGCLGRVCNNRVFSSFYPIPTLKRYSVRLGTFITRAVGQDAGGLEDFARRDLRDKSKGAMFCVLGERRYLSLHSKRSNSDFLLLLNLVAKPDPRECVQCFYISIYRTC